MGSDPLAGHRTLRQARSSTLCTVRATLRAISRFSMVMSGRGGVGMQANGAVTSPKSLNPSSFCTAVCRRGGVGMQANGAAPPALTLNPFSSCMAVCWRGGVGMQASGPAPPALNPKPLQLLHGRLSARRG